MDNMELILGSFIRPRETVLFIIPVGLCAFAVGPVLFLISLYSYEETKSLLGRFDFLGKLDNMKVFVIQTVISILLFFLVLGGKTCCFLRMSYLLMGIDAVWMFTANTGKYAIFIDEYENKMLCFDYLLRLLDEQILYLFFVYILFSYCFHKKNND